MFCTAKFRKKRIAFDQMKLVHINVSRLTVSFATAFRFKCRINLVTLLYVMPVLKYFV